MSAVCHRCGGDKHGPFVPCKACGFTPLREDRLVAWLFSLHHLDAAELTDAADRIRGGDRPDPSRTLREVARVGMGALPLSNIARKPLPLRTLLLLSSANVLLTPLAGFAVWFGMREDRPVAAAQALRITIPVTAVLALLWCVTMVLLFAT